MSSEVKTVPTRLMLAGFAAGILLHIDQTPPWCVVVALAALLWHWLYSVGRVRLPPSWLRVLITLGLFAATAATFQTIGGLLAGSALLLVMGAAKLLETRTTRDVTVSALVSLVLVLAACLDRQSLARVPLYLGCGWIALATIAAVGSSNAGDSPRRALFTAGRTLLLSLPFAALCFVLVPRLQGALWSMPNSGAGQTGLADEMSPGSISELSNSDDIAFRVRFEGAAPPEAQRYWRGPVLHNFDGYTWRRLKAPAAREPSTMLLSGPVHYHVMLEATGRTFLFGIDRVASIKGRGNSIAFDGEVMAYRPVTDTVAYDGTSFLHARSNGPLSDSGRRLDTQLPPGRNPRAIALAREMRQKANSDWQYAQRMLDYFRTSGFRYTLNPPLLEQDSVDDLIFHTRLGFCGHFASAYATLMRAAGIPARVVTGYLGATWNPVGGFYTVRQSQAHAWTELWIDGEGWVRVDPTTVVAPERLQQGASELLARNGSTMRSLFGEVQWLRDLRDSWDAASGWWQERIVNFNRSAQLDLLKRLGLGDIDFAGMAMLLGAGALLWGFALIAVFLRKARGARADALNVTWNRFIALLVKRGMVVATHEGPRAIATRAMAQWPAAAAEIEQFTRRYEALRFGTAENSEAAVSALRVLLRRIAHATAARRHP